LTAATNPDANARARLLELLGELPSDQGRLVLRVLAEQDRPEDAVTERARGTLEEQELRHP
jgi:hypothetical protein